MVCMDTMHTHSSAPLSLTLPCCRTHACVPQAANYLNIKGLLDLTCQTVANMIKGEAAALVAGQGTRCWGGVWELAAPRTTEHGTH